MRIRLIAVVAALVLAPCVAAAPGLPPHGKVLLGVTGPDPDTFDRLTGRHHALHVMYGSWTGPVADIVTADRAAGRLPVLTLPMTLSPAEVARGGEDPRWVALSQQLNGTGEEVWVRVFAEMTGYWNPWCAFDESGRSRGPSHGTSSFVAAFRRVTLILRGGTAAKLDARLRAAGLAPLQAQADIPPSGRVSIVWNPQGHGVPYVAANGPQAYWPGAAYVDIVADDMYSDSGEPSWQGLDALYAYGKPFLVAEWGLKGSDDSAFAARIFAWVAAHPRTVGLVYFNKGWSGGSGIFELRSKPRALALYRRAVRDARFATKSP